MANSYLNRTTGSPTLGTKVTVSAWIKISEVPGGSGTDRWLFGEYGNGSNHSYLYLRNSSEIGWYEADGSGTVASIITNRLCRDLNGWYHFMIAFDTTDSTQADRFKMYINGERQTSFSTNTNNIAQNYLPRINRTGRTYHIGGVSGYQTMFNGYMSHVAQVDGQALAPTVFGQTDSTSGIWKFKSPTGVTWGNNGYHLKMENSGAMGTDSSGNSNTFTVNGDLKQALDTPSNVYCTINPLYRMDLSNNATMSNGNTTFSSDQSGYNIRYGTLGVNKGKWYYEAKFISHNPQTSPGMPFGISGSQIPAGQQNAGYAQYDYSYNYDGSNGTVQANNTATNYGTLPLNTIGQIGMCAFDLDNNKLYFGVNGVWANSGNPGGNANGFTIADPDNTELGFYFPSTADRSSNRSYVYSFNFGNGFFGTTAITSAGSNGNGSLFEYDCPTGYYALNTKNINTYG